MKSLPISYVYEEEFRYMPWRKTIEKVLAALEAVPENGRILDLMCGPGYLLGEIDKSRADLKLRGVDINSEFIQYARRKYRDIFFEIGDALNYIPPKKVDAVVCTGGIHHLPYDKQEFFLEGIADMIKPDGFAVFADPLIDDYSNEQERRLAAAKLGYEYMKATIKKGAPDEIVEATVDILHNDVMGCEFKTSLSKLTLILEGIFSNIAVEKVWPKKQSKYGDYCFVCKP